MASSTSSLTGSLNPMPVHSEATPLLSPSSSAPTTYTLPLDPADYTVPIVTDPPLDPICCESLAGRCQRIEDCAAIMGEAVALVGLAYAIYSRNEVLTILFAVTAFCFGAVIIWNKTCGNLPSINRQYVQATRKLQQLQTQQGTIVNGYQAVVSSYKQITAQSRIQTDMLNSLAQKLSGIDLSMQRGVSELEKQNRDLERVNSDLKAAVATEKEANQSLRLQIEDFTSKLAVFNSGISAATSSVAALRKVDEELEHSDKEMAIHSVQIHEQVNYGEAAIREQAELLQRLSSENQDLQRQLTNIQSQLTAEQSTSSQLSEENERLAASLEQVRSQLLQMESNMRINIQKLTDQNTALLAERDTLATLQRSMEQARSTSSSSGSHERVSSQTELTLNLQKATRDIRLEIAALNRGESQ